VFGFGKSFVSVLEIFSKKLAWFSAGLPAGLGWLGLALGWPGCRASWLAVRAPLCVFGGAVVVLAGFLFGF